LADDAVPRADDVFDVQTESDRTDNTLFNAMATLGASRLLPTTEEIASLAADGFRTLKKRFGDDEQLVKLIEKETDLVNE
jgi:hypothetical protein